MPETFLRAANIREIQPGEKKLVNIGDTRILLVNLEGTFYALEGKCTHASVTLSRGQIQGENIVCPLHKSEFNIKSGAAVTPPAIRNLTVYDVRIQGEEILIRNSVEEP
ncbi:MAG: Rieske (2Fe-2S) protein [Dehalococcoidia bacterium]